jgi:nucleoside-diphosphate-sugar epimerase
MNILMTGATGFLGKTLVRRLLADGRIGEGHPPFKSLVLLGRNFPNPPDDPRVRLVHGDIRDAAVRAEALRERVDCVFHLAGLLIAQTEPNFDLGREVNLTATLDLCEDLRSHGCPLFLFTSTIGVYGPSLPDLVDDDTLPRPNLTYGAHKLMIEYYLADFARRGFLDARSVRVPGTLPRPRLPDRTFSPAFGSNLIHAMAAGEKFHSPVSANATLWAVSRRWTIENILRSASIAQDRLPRHRVWQLPALHLTMGELAAGVAAKIGADRASLVTWDPIPELESALGRFPRLVTKTSDDLGLRHDGDVGTLIDNVLADMKTGGI